MKWKGKRPEAQLRRSGPVPNGGVVNHGYRSGEYWRKEFQERDKLEERREREITLTIETGPRGEFGEPGFELVGGRDDPYFDESPGVFVLEVTPGSSVDKTLDAGDEILEIDGVSISNVPLHVAVNLIRAANGRVVINVLKHPDNEMGFRLPEDSDDSGPEIADDDEVFTASSLDTGGSVNLLDETAEGEEVVVEFMTGRRGDVDELDFEFAGGKDQPCIPRNGGIFITSVKRGSLLEGQITAGDRIAKIEGIEMGNVPQHVFTNLIRASDGKLSMTVKKANRKQVTMSTVRGDEFDVSVNKTAQNDEFIVEIKTGPKGRRGELGFKIAGGRNKPCFPGDPGIFILAVKPGSAVEKIMRPGDEILTIDGINVTNINQSRAMDLIKAADHKVCLHIKRANHESRVALRNNRRMNEEFPEEKIEEFKTAFELYGGKNGDRIPIKALPGLCKSLGYNLTIQDLDYLVSEYHNGSSRITFSDFIGMMSELNVNNKKDTEILEAFGVFDKERKGYFSLTDLKSAFECMPGQASMTAGEMENVLSIADPNQDGRVYFRDFKNLVMPLFQQY